MCITGTTCATVLTQAIFSEGCKSVAAGVNVMDLRKGINIAVDAVVSHLKSRAFQISTPDEITQVRRSCNFEKIPNAQPSFPYEALTGYVDDLIVSLM